MKFHCPVAMVWSFRRSCGISGGRFKAAMRGLMPLCALHMTVRVCYLPWRSVVTLLGPARSLRPLVWLRLRSTRPLSRFALTSAGCPAVAPDF